MEANITYPQYRKYPNNKGYFKIVSPDEWEEVQVVGSNYFVHTFKVTIFPDRNFVYDMTFDYDKNWVRIGEEEYEQVRKYVKGGAG